MPIAPIGDLLLSSGAVLPDAQLAYTTYGTLAPDASNAVLLTHGYTSSYHMAGSSEGAWGGLVGPGLAIDTDRFFVISSNMLGSAYGSTAPRSINPATGREYGPDFPAITLADIVQAQRQMLDAMGIGRLRAVVGPSYGGFQAFQWAVTWPDSMDAIIPVVSAPSRPDAHLVADLLARFQADPDWNDGWYYGRTLASMVALREETLRRYGIEAELTAAFPDRAARDGEIRRQATTWAEAFDAHSMLVLGRAIQSWSVLDRVPSIRARVLYVLSRTDALFPPSLAPGVMAALAQAGVAARYVEIDSEHGHLASGTDAARWAPDLRAFMEQLA